MTARAIVESFRNDRRRRGACDRILRRLWSGLHAASPVAAALLGPVPGGGLSAPRGGAAVAGAGAAGARRPGPGGIALLPATRRPGPGRASP